MWKFAMVGFWPVLMFVGAAAQAYPVNHGMSRSPAELYAVCNAFGSPDYASETCESFRAAAMNEVAACLQETSGGMQGYRAQYLRCVAEQRARLGAAPH